MNTAITVGDIVVVLAALSGFLGLAGLVLAAIWLLNPFRSGH